MPRVKRGVRSKKHRKHLLKHAKGFRYGRKSKFKLAKDALRHAWTYAFRDRKRKKREFRRLWNVQISAKLKEKNLNYSRFFHLLKKKKIQLDRKILAQLARSYPQIFEKIVEEVKS